MDKKTRIIITVSTVALLVGGYFGYQELMYVSTDDAQVEGHALLLAPKVSGYIKAVKVIEGQKVKAGETLIEIDSRDYQNALKQMESEMTSIEARRIDAERTYRRVSELYSKAAVSRQQYDTAFTEFSEAKAEIRIHFGASRSGKTQLGEHADQSSHQRHDREKITRRSGNSRHPECRWSVLSRFGRALGDGQFQKETELSGIQVGAKAYLDVDAVPHRTFNGEVEAISAATGATFTLLPPDNATGNFTKVVQRVPVKIKINDAGPEDIERLRAGLSVYAKVRKRWDPKGFPSHHLCGGSRIVARDHRRVDRERFSSDDDGKSRRDAGRHQHGCDRLRDRECDRTSCFGVAG